MRLYWITNIATGMFYIGSTINVDKRLKEHLNALRRNKHHCVYLQRAWNKYGETSFTFESVECHTDTISECREMEQRLLDEYIGSGLIYNTSPSATGGCMLSRGTIEYENWKMAIGVASRNRPPISDYTRHIQSESKKGDNNPSKRPEVRLVIGRSSTGRIHTDETKNIISLKTSGENNGMYGRTHSTSTRALIGAKSGASRLGKKRGPYNTNRRNRSN